MVFLGSVLCSRVTNSINVITMTKLCIQDKIDGNELDLSLNELTEIPVKELALAKKATHLDLSCNHIEYLPDNFATLVHLVKIDLSKNLLKELPDNFGNLKNLQYLDLYGNKLKIIPVSFCRLKSLRWLDLKNNPLDPKLKAIAGDCLDEKQCQACAKSVVSFMQAIESDLEREKQKKLREIREKEAAQKLIEEQKLEQQRRLKKVEREKRKAESKAKKESTQKSNPLQQSDSDNGSVKTAKPVVSVKKSKKSAFWMKLFMFCITLCISTVATVLSIRVYHNKESIHSFEDGIRILNEFFTELHDVLHIWWTVFIYPHLLSTKSFVYHHINSVFNLTE